MSKITNRIDIGDRDTSYEPYDIIINLNYPYNGMGYGQLQETIDGRNNKLIIRIGMPDTPEESENMLRLLKKIIPRLVFYYLSNPNAKFLFHCYAGVSRSATLCIAMLMTLFNIDAYEAYQVAKKGRHIINPNQGFVDALIQFENTNNE
jgi:protein-tyrosine phosphatase